MLLKPNRFKFVRHRDLDLRSFAYALVTQRRHLAHWWGFLLGDWYIGVIHIPTQPHE